MAVSCYRHAHQHASLAYWRSRSDTGLRKTIEAVQEWIDERLARPGCDNFLVDLVPATPSLVNESYTQSTVSGEQSLREVIGVLGSPDVPRVGYIFHPSYYGKGYATEALKAYIESYWKRLIPGSFDFASAATDVENLPSRRLLEKSGFVLQRIEKQAHNNPFKGGWRDDAIYLITRPGTSTSQAGISGQNYENVEDETSKLAN